MATSRRRGLMWLNAPIRAVPPDEKGRSWWETAQRNGFTQVAERWLGVMRASRAALWVSESQKES